MTIGNFDGVHRGHAQLIGELTNLAHTFNGPAVVVTFDPHPLSILRPAAAPARLTTVERKASLLNQLGVQHVVVLTTTAEMLCWEPARFFETVLVRSLQSKLIVEGPNFRFGKDRDGDIRLLRELCVRDGVGLEVVKPLAETDQWISSTRIRLLLGEGRIEAANQLLTAPYRIAGRVVTGAQRGRLIGFPTLNLADITTLTPGHGAYGGRITIDGRPYRAALNIGPNPTFDEASDKIEVHVLDWSGDLYGATVEIELLYRLRDIRRFNGVEELSSQLQQHMQQIRELIALEHFNHTTAE